MKASEENYKTEPYKAAFARAESDNYYGAPGLTKREYFANSAPNVPEWFEPVFETAEPKRPLSFSGQFGFYSNHPQKELIEKFFYDETGEWSDNGEVTEDLKNEVKEFTDNSMSVYKKWQDDTNKWQHDYNLARFIQWRTFYADALIAELNKQS